MSHNIIIDKHTQKYIDKVHPGIKNKIDKAMLNISKKQGNILKMKNTHCIYPYIIYEYKMEGVRILFHYEDEKIIINQVSTKNGVKFRKCGVHN